MDETTLIAIRGLTWAIYVCSVALVGSAWLLGAAMFMSKRHDH